MLGAVSVFLIAIASDAACFTAYGFLLPALDPTWIKPASFVTVGAMGFGVGLGSVAFGVLIQTEIPKRLLGSVTASAHALGAALALLGPAVGAVLAETVSIPFPFQVTAVLMASALAISAICAAGQDNASSPARRRSA